MELYSIDELYKARVKPFTRTRRGKMERVSEFERRSPFDKYGHPVSDLSRRGKKALTKITSDEELAGKIKLLNEKFMSALSESEKLGAQAQEKQDAVNQLRERYGEDDPRSMSAYLKFVDLWDQHEAKREEANNLKDAIDKIEKLLSSKISWKGKRPWQTDPSSLTTKRVQVWLESGTMMGSTPLEEAQRLVKEGKAFVITDQAIQIERKGK